MTVTGRTAASTRAKHALGHLEQHPATTRGQLGAARDQLNIVHNFNDQGTVDDAVFAIECLVLDVYGSPPACPNCQ